MTGVLDTEEFRVTMVPALTEAEGHEPSVECLALASAACAGIPADEDLLIALVAEQWDTRCLACMLVVLIHSHDEHGYGLQAFREFFDADPQKLARLGVIDCLALMNAFALLDLGYAAPPALRDELHRRLDDATPAVRQRASFALGIAGLDDAATREALERIIDQEAIGGAVAGAVLGRSWLNDAEPVLLRVQRTDPDWRVRAAATWVLGFRGVDDPIAFRDVREEVKAIAIAMSGEASSSATLAEVLKMVRDEKAGAGLRLGAAANLCQRTSQELVQLGRDFLLRFQSDPAFESQHAVIGYLLRVTPAGEETS